MTPQWDVAVVGGGVVGCAILHDLSLQGYSCVLLERQPHLLMGASSGNSGLYASGFDTCRQSLEGRCLAQAAALNHRAYTKYGIPTGQRGAVVVALTPAQLKKLPKIVEDAEKYGVCGCRELSSHELHQMEPHLTDSAVGGVWVPGEVAVEPWRVPITLVHAARRAGAQVFTQCDVVSGRQCTAGTWKLVTTCGPVTAKVVINAGGLYGDKVEEISHKSSFKIQPRKGEYVVYGKEASQFVNHIILPVPTEQTKGVIIFPTVYKNLVVGPTAKDVDERHCSSVDNTTVTSLISHAEHLIPALKHHKIIGTYAGLRPATQSNDYQIYSHPHRSWVTVGGIRSTGLSACLAIAKHVRFLLKKNIGILPSKDVPSSNGAATFWLTNKETVVMDGVEYHVTHPITRFGLELEGVKSKL